MARVFAKLVRDRQAELPDPTPERGIPEFRTANSEAGRFLGLALKLHEGAGGVISRPDDPAEYADLLEVMLAMAELQGVAWERVERELLARRETRGRFRRGLVLTRRGPPSE